MPVNYSALASAATRLIGENGRIVTMRRESRTPADVTKPWKGNDGVGQTIQVKAVLVPYTLFEMPDDQMRKSSMKAFIAMQAFGTLNDANDMEFMDDAITGTWRVLKVEVIQPADIGVLYSVELKK